MNRLEAMQQSIDWHSKELLELAHNEHDIDSFNVLFTSLQIENHNFVLERAMENVISLKQIKKVEKQTETIDYNFDFDANIEANKRKADKLAQKRKQDNLKVMHSYNLKGKKK